MTRHSQAMPARCNTQSNIRTAGTHSQTPPSAAHRRGAATAITYGGLTMPSLFPWPVGPLVGLTTMRNPPTPFVLSSAASSASLSGHAAGHRRA